MITDQIVAGLVGGVIGACFGLGVRGWLIILDRRRVPVEEQRSRLFRVLRWAAAVLAMVTVVGSAIIAYEASEETKALAVRNSALVAEVNRRDLCVTDVIVAFVDAADERSTLAEELTRTEAGRLRAQLAFLRASETQVPETVRPAYEAYIASLEEQLGLELRQAETQRTHQFPSKEEIEACR